MTLRNYLLYPLLVTVVGGVAVLFLDRFFFSETSPQDTEIRVNQAQVQSNPQFFVQEARVTFEYDREPFLWFFGESYHQKSIDATIVRTGDPINHCSVYYNYSSKDDSGRVFGGSGLMLRNPLSSQQEYPFAQEIDIPKGATRLFLAVRLRRSSLLDWLEMKVRCGSEETVWTDVRLDRVG